MTAALSPAGSLSQNPSQKMSQTSPQNMSQTAPQTAPQTDPAWLQPVQQFFSRFNWDDQPPEVQKFQSAAVLEADLSGSLLLTVSQFLSTVPWEGSLLAGGGEAARSARLEDSLPAEAFTLDDFSSLF